MPKYPEDYKIGAVDLKVEKVVEDEKKVKESDVFGKKKSSKAKQTKRKPKPRPRPRSY